MDKLIFKCGTCVQWSTVQTFKTNEILSSVTTWKETEIIMLCEIGQAWKVKNCMISSICRIFFKS
jgi:hypothetical protein